MCEYEIKPSVDVVHAASKKTFNIPSSMLKTVDGTTFFNVNPARCRKIGTLLFSRCSTAVRNKNQDFSFWYKKGGAGYSKILAPIVKMRKGAIKAKFSIVGDRLSARKKEARAQQLASDAIDVPFPATDSYPPRCVSMYIDPEVKREGTSKLWVELKKESVECLLNFVQHAMSSDGQDGSDDPAAEDSASEDEPVDDGASGYAEEETQNVELHPIASAVSESSAQPKSTGFRIFDALLGRK